MYLSKSEEVQPSGKGLHNYGTSPCSMGKFNYFDWAMFSSYVKLQEGNNWVINGREMVQWVDVGINYDLHDG